jgi:hypothetical protein
LNNQLRNTLRRLRRDLHFAMFAAEGGAAGIRKLTKKEVEAMEGLRGWALVAIRAINDLSREHHGE